MAPTLQALLSDGGAAHMIGLTMAFVETPSEGQ
ncbi:hypothetical protein H4W29_004488 [Rhizobium viscosum]|uniref:Uncharacterized protein n=1 Tax=Rhizobium viscosum TaxID=1673 RepID=A0ABR9IVN9_RHIVS|nr:hypothetical protein [Rhizobium viscosum]